MRVVWRAFELQPSAPKVAPQGLTLVEHLARKLGASTGQAQHMIDSMTQRGAAIGLPFRFDRVRPDNTFDAHRLLHLGLERNCQSALKERLFVAYMNEGKSIGDVATLVALAQEVGLDPDETRAVLQSDAYAREVRAEQDAAMQLGITGVPFFVVAGRYAVRGAQGSEALLNAMQRVRDDLSEGQQLDGPGQVCGPDGCLLPSSP